MARCLKNERHARPVFYGAMVAEGIVAIIWATAAMAYFGAALLFEKSGDRPQALFRAWEVLRDLKDARCEEFAKILREKYPDNAYTKQLK